MQSSCVVGISQAFRRVRRDGSGNTARHGAGASAQKLPQTTGRMYSIIYTPCLEKKIADIIDCNLKKDCLVSVIFGTYISENLFWDTRVQGRPRMSQLVFVRTSSELHQISPNYAIKFCRNFVRTSSNLIIFGINHRIMWECTHSPPRLIYVSALPCIVLH